MILGFRKKKDKVEPEEEQEIEYVLFRGALNGKEANLAENARLAEAGLVPVKELVTDALMRRAEILRIEPKGNVSGITFSVDGVWYPGGRLAKQQALAVVQMLKLLAGLETAQRKKAQTGGVNTELSGVKYQLHVESTPVAGGAERLVVRIVNPKNKIETPEEVGIPTRMRNRVRALSAEKRGVIVVCGPPKSGVTTATIGVVRCIDSFLYTIYNMADLSGRELSHVVDFKTTQDDDLETTISRAIRVEADMILMSPLREAETTATLFKMQEKVCFIAELAARDAAYGIAQLNRWLNDPELLARGLVAAVSQKMIRLLCAKCKQAYKPNPKLAARIGLPPETRVLYRPPVPPEPNENGEVEPYEPCDVCGETGYFGRTALFEFIETSEGMREVIAAGASVEAIKRQAKKENMMTFQQEGLRMVSEGKTSLEELQRLFKAQ